HTNAQRCPRRRGQPICCVYRGVFRYDQAGNLSDSSGGPFLRQLALPIADQGTTRYVGTRNALNGRLLVRPRVQIGFDANRDNGMQLRFLLRHWCCLVVTKSALITNVYYHVSQPSARKIAMKNPVVVSGGVPGGERPGFYRQKFLNRSGASSL